MDDADVRGKAFIEREGTRDGVAPSCTVRTCGREKGSTIRVFGPVTRACGAGVTGAGSGGTGAAATFAYGTDAGSGAAGGACSAIGGTGAGGTGAACTGAS
ncbi:hypothetical protein GHA01_20650 [Novacetimonas hansenii]|uniref:Uncharacterized protein n=1 Tax=Novacetimonas hansenii TaxID=436 RepID=A0ABQ0SFS5_NOVHA|nr:hypothetical protein Gaha_0061_014 [Novacetimonas hansenii JCM 7643]GBQ61179.1 hypothetical protein AA0243_2581 [Novacetimonas hansenii NRIC 0243]GEC64216.1 hypothetical protein GHA01_20650 [Novacetimonas hansenii]